ncbi:DUF5802 family protein [Halosimplex salinum]|uniref:DUF5802 family protein n=1 Tax=Halosimplex salinum TaxID=1710538 RepID=UPI000F481682|nr:DUF5802 family protein [Halosimplex salinum]
MFEQFSSGYYLGRLYVEPRDDDAAAIARTQHEQVNEQLYAGEGIERTDLPLVMKLENTHFTVYGDERVPADTIAVPEELVEETRIRNPPALREVFLAKAERAKQLLSVAAGTPTSDEAMDAAVPDHPFDGGPFGDGTFDGPTGI